MESDQGMMEGQKAIMEGAKKMMDAKKITSAAVEKMGPEIVKECSIGLDSCMYGEKKINEGALEMMMK